MAWSGIGMNYWGNRDAATVAANLTYLYSLGVRQLRHGMPNYNDSSSIATMQASIVIAKQMGFYNIWGVKHDVTITSTNWATIKTGVLAKALAASQLATPPDEFMIENEATLGHDGTIASTTIRADLKTMATTVKGYANWKISFGESELDQEGNDNIDTWNSVGIGSFDYVSFHVYDNLANFNTRVNKVVANWGNNGYLSEWGPNASISSLTASGWTEDRIAIEIAQKLQLLKNSGIRAAHYYTFNADTSWGLLNETTGLYHVPFSVLFGGRRFLTE